MFTKQVFSPKYHQFCCIAEACSDSCCTDWEIVLDEKTENYYHTIPGILGVRLRKAMIRDAYGDTIFQKKDHRCPFWNEHHLCDIHVEIGEAALCDTCRMFPRLTQDYGDFIEYDLSIACPEAARIMLTMPLDAWTLTEENHPEHIGDIPEYSPERMEQLQKQRMQLFAKMKDTSYPATVQLEKCLYLSCGWENMPFPQMSARIVCSEEVCLHFLQSCEILTQDWRKMLEQAVDTQESRLTMDETLDKEIRLFVIDVLYRYYLRSVFEETADFPVQLAAFSVCAVLTLIRRLKIQTQSERLRIWQLFVKEVEYDNENMELLKVFFETDWNFSPTALCRRLFKEGASS